MGRAFQALEQERLASYEGFSKNRLDFLPFMPFPFGERDHQGKVRAMKAVVKTLFLASGLFAATAMPALAMPESCQQDLNKYGQSRLDAINRINAFKNKRPSATQACSAFGNLASAEQRMIKWMEGNKEWCQIPDALVDDLKKSLAQSSKVRGQACSAAKKEAQMRAQGGVPGGAAPPRSSVRLPQGAL
jgi:hypothetical protein